jgi:3-hydroxy acid dehydrogenase/malonic semialdehyde reductase
MSLSDYRKVLVTGASSGIGEAVVRRLTRHNLEVHALARRQDRLSELARATGCVPLALDLRDTDALYDTLESTEYDVLINNAGLGRGYNSLAAASREDISRTIETNVTAAIHVVHALLPGMIARRRGHLVNLGSIAGLYPMPTALYSASKGALHLLSQGLRMELKGSAVRCTEICPARVRTEFFDTAFDDPTKAEQAALGFELLEPSDIADAILYALDAPWRVNVSTIEITPTEQYIGGIYIEPVGR